MARYRFYREHKYVSHELNTLERKIAVCDFRDQSAVESIQQDFISLRTMLGFHAEHENKAIHELLRTKGSKLHQACEEDHKEQEKVLEEIFLRFEAFKTLKGAETRLEQGQNLYLFYRKFLAEFLLHLDHEETQIMPELWRLCTDEELGSVDAGTYELMSPEQMIEMLDVLGPHMNPSDLDFFKADIRRTQPDKYESLTRIVH